MSEDKKYIVGNCVGCGNLTAASICLDDRERDKENAMQFMESGHTVRIVRAIDNLGVELCACLTP